jgi:acyl dehydratase
MNLPKDTAPRSPIYFDDLKVGDTFVTDEFALDAEQITTFAAQFDPQPFHLDDAAARQTMFAGLAASGWHTAAITMRLLVTSGPPLVNGIVGAGGEIEWNSPTRPGDVLHVESEVVSLIPSRSRPERGVAVLRSKTLNQRGAIVQTLTAKLMVSRRQPQT